MPGNRCVFTGISRLPRDPALIGRPLFPLRCARFEKRSTRSSFGLPRLRAESPSRAAKAPLSLATRRRSCLPRRDPRLLRLRPRPAEGC